MKHHMIVMQHLLGEYVHYRLFTPSIRNGEILSQEGVTTHSSIERYFIGTHYHETEYIENMRRFTKVSLKEEKGFVRGAQLLNQSSVDCDLWDKVKKEAVGSHFMDSVSLVRYIDYSDIYQNDSENELKDVLVELLVLGGETGKSQLFKTNLFYEQDIPLIWSDGLLGERYPHLRDVLSSELSESVLDTPVMRCLLLKE